MANDSAGISQLKSLLDWKLLRGTHLWPGPDGGTCILEAAIVAAGLPYRSVSLSRRCPSGLLMGGR